MSQYPSCGGRPWCRPTPGPGTRPDTRNASALMAHTSPVAVEHGSRRQKSGQGFPVAVSLSSARKASGFDRRFWLAMAGGERVPSSPPGYRSPQSEAHSRKIALRSLGTGRFAFLEACGAGSALPRRRPMLNPDIIRENKTLNHSMKEQP